MNDQEMLRVIEFVQQTRSPLHNLMQLSDDDPIWNVTAFLMKNEILGLPVTVASLVQVTGIPYTTSRRLVARLIAEGHIVRMPRTRSGKTYALHPSKELATTFRQYAGEIKSLIARTLGMRPTKETEDDYYFGGTPSLSQTMLPRNLFQKQYTENLELRFLLCDDNYFMAMRNMWADLRCNLASRRNFDLLQQPQLYQKAAENGRRAVSEYDVVTIDMAWLGEFAERGFIRPVGDLQNQDVNPHGFHPIIWSTGLWNGVEYGVPIYCTAQLLATRRDLFQEKGIAAPKTFDEVINAGRAFHEPAKGRYGAVWDAAAGMPIAQSFMFFMGACGSPVISLPRTRSGFTTQGIEADKLLPLVQSDAGRAALDYMHRLVEISPHDILEKAWDEALGVFLSGRSAMAYCETMRASRLDGDIHSVVRRKVEYVPQPAGLSAGRVTPIGGYLLIIPSNLPEDRVKLAAEAISWMTSHDAMKAHVTNGFPIAPRFSVSADPESVVASPLVRVVEGFARRHLLQTWQRPAVRQYKAIEAVLGQEIHAALSNQKSDYAALSSASERMVRILGSGERVVRIATLRPERRDRRSAKRQTVAAE
jgi:ABC-type glycerol-3-phosphate transport system substrate-binding protein